MAQKDTAKPWFKIHAYPTQAQFWQLFDWLWFKDEKIPVASIDGLSTLLNNLVTLAQVAARFIDQFTLFTDGTYAMTAGQAITGMVIITDTAFTLNVGTAAGGNDVVNAYEVPAGQASITMLFFSAGAQTLYFSGIAASTKFIILKNSIPA
jgi:hypothetical protein